MSRTVASARALGLAALVACLLAGTARPSATRDADAVVAPAPVAATTTDACGALLTKPDGTYWTCTLVDEFPGTTLSSNRWSVVTTAQSGFTSGKDCFVNSANNVRVADGTLRLTVRRTASLFTCSSPRGSFSTRYTAGMITSFPRFGQTYGRFAIRARFPSAKVAGLHSAYWLYPADPAKYGPWPASGEIDVAEFYTQYPARVVPYVHYLGDEDDPGVTNTRCLVSHPERFHNYVVEWTPELITVKYDGVTCIKDKWQPWQPQVKPQPFDQPFVLNLTQALGSGTNAVTSSTPLPGTMYVDRVRVWR